MLGGGVYQLKFDGMNAYGGLERLSSQFTSEMVGGYEPVPDNCQPVTTVMTLYVIFYFDA